MRDLTDDETAARLDLWKQGLTDDEMAEAEGVSRISIHHWRRRRGLSVNRVPTYHGLSAHPLYRTWQAMLQRCLNPRATGYYRYGGRGVAVHPDWVDTPANFIEWVSANLGPRPDGHSLDRIDGDGNYEPGNLRWATAKEQAQNRRRRRNATA